MNGWNRVNKHRYELIYNNKPYLTAVYYRTPYEDINKVDMKENIFVENSINYNSSINYNNPFLYREFKEIDTKKLSITNILRIIQLEYLLVSLIRKNELIDNINNKEYLKIIKSIYEDKYDYVIDFIKDNYDKLYILSDEISYRKDKNNENLLNNIDNIIANPDKYRVININDNKPIINNSLYNSELILSSQTDNKTYSKKIKYDV